MRITIPDTLADVYAEIASTQGRSLDDVVTAQLDRFQRLTPGTRAVVIGGALLDHLDELLGSHLRDGQDLATKVSRLAAITFHNVKLDFTPSQLEELARRADRRGKTVEQLAREIIRDLSEQFFWGYRPEAASAEHVPAAPTPVKVIANDRVVAPVIVEEHESPAPAAPEPEVAEGASPLDALQPSTT